MSIRKITNKNGISYSITITKGRNSQGKQIRHYKTFIPPQTWSEKRMEKEAQKVEIDFKKEIDLGFSLNNKQNFYNYANYVIDLKERNGTKHRTITLYKHLMKRIEAEIGHIKISDLKPQHLNNFYKNLSECFVSNDSKVHSKSDLKAILKKNGFTKIKFCELSGISKNTLDVASKGKNVSYKTAEKIAIALNTKIENLFKIQNANKVLSNKTIIEYHRLISTVLAQAEKEMLVQFNVAAKASPPKLNKREVNYFEPEIIEKIRICLENEPLKWKLFTHLLLITGCRRGEITGLKWSKIDFKNNQIKIDTSLLASKERGIYEDTTKTGFTRFIKLPTETIDLIKQHRKEYFELQEKNGARWNNTDYVFVRDNGLPMHPDSITGWLRKFSKKHKLPHINPHAFRHTHASILYFNGINRITISKRLGHAKVSTTTDIYSHIIKQSDEQASECVADVFLHSKTK